MPLFEGVETPWLQNNIDWKSISLFIFSNWCLSKSQKTPDVWEKHRLDGEGLLLISQVPTQRQIVVFKALLVGFLTVLNFVGENKAPSKFYSN